VIRLRVELLEDRTVPAGHGVTNPTPVGLTPAEVQHAYGFDQIATLAGDYNAAGAGQTIAIVMAGDQPNIQSDLHVFDQTFGLPDPVFVKLNQNGSSTGRWPTVNSSWAGEISLDVEWAHAIAPAAKIVLVEANSARVSDLVAAIDTARHYAGVSVVSMSWGLLQGTGMNAYETYFTTPAGHTPVTFVACTLDNGLSYPNGLYWPSVSPHVLAVGGTSLTLNADGSYGSEVGWGPSTGGISTWFAQPAYQAGVVTQPTRYRSVPDVSYHADNSSKGFAVYDTVALNGQTGWFNAYGDSAGAPQWGALVALADQQRAANGLPTLDGASQVLPALYGLARSDATSFYHDITTGANGKYSAGDGYDLVTGLGSPRPAALVPALASVAGSGSAVAFAAPSGSGSEFGGSAQPGGGFLPPASPSLFLAPGPTTPTKRDPLAPEWDSVVPV
jgi:subtilase family serine protease